MTQPPGKLEDHLGYWLRFVSNHVSHAFRLKVEAQGVTVAEWVLLRAMYDAGAASPGHLADTLGLTPGTVSKLVERLRRKALVTRVTSREDRRCQTVALTDRGQALVPTLAKLADENDREYFGHLSAKHRIQLLNEFKALVQRHGWNDLPIN